ncbi:hypothetical protein M405DRAFT_861823 [Rhizopogon salebrosus TDB-379]|nr:hypothetical protein M405DRAFT_861823 [Rhizopogon salebrosus TDB-379]
MTHRRSQHAIGGVDFKINPTLIDSTAIRKLHRFPDASGGLGDVWKCSMSTPSGTRTVAVKCIRVAFADDEELIQKSGKRIHREAHVWITLSHDHILPLLGITMSDGFGPLPALVSPWMENRSLNDYLKREFPQLSDHRKLELVGAPRPLRRFILTSDFRYGRWLLVFVIVRLIHSDGIIHQRLYPSARKKHRAWRPDRGRSCIYE